ncbi:MAG: hypothetical protein JXX29_01085 [Deltaproteobacteria bacterium]|nr:hypothetical protein [Deltaproteobacteria bacterium]MBN2670232.1 hypothetical protein [Deltaproteobacteria bacterium]
MFKSPTICVGLDIGSNTISCTQVHRNEDGAIDVLNDASFPVRLSEGLSEGGELNPAAIERGLSALKEIVNNFDYHQSRSRAVGTAVLRMTAHPEAFTEPAEKILKTPIRIIDGLEEARLTAIGAVFGLPAREDWVVLDIGGQSTEISCLKPCGSLHSVSMPLGVVKVTERFFSSQTPSRDEQQQARQHVRDCLHKHLGDDIICGNLVCVGGTPTTLSLLVHKLAGWQRDKVHGDVISLADTQAWFEKIVVIDAQTRIDQYGMRPMRADVFPAGILILDEIMQYFDFSSFTVSANGLRVGLAISTLESVSD